MKRLLISIGGGLLIPILLFALLPLVGPLLQMAGAEWALNLLMHSFLGPLKIWMPIFPNSCPSCGPTDEAIIATIITDFLFYSLLTHLVQMIIARARSRGVGALSEGRA